jgi:acetolactate synthase small subunit
MSKYTVELLVDNWSAALERITGVFERQNYRIDSINAGPAVGSNASRITIVSMGDDSMNQVIKHLGALHSVHEAMIVSREGL